MMNNEELILQMLTEMKEDIKETKDDIKDLKREVKKLHKSDDLILDEVERVHEI